MTLRSTGFVVIATVSALSISLTWSSSRRAYAPEIHLSAANALETDGQPITDSHVGVDNHSFAEIVERWNGDFLWAPASADSKATTRSGDEARAVFGPIPDGDCTDAAKSLPLEIEGNIVDLKPNPGLPGNPLEFEHRNAEGQVVKWTATISRCDKPSLAGNVTYCGMNSRLNRVSHGNVEWLTLCRKSTRYLDIEPDPYWQKSNSKFARLGTIGFNKVTGEIVFFDGREDGEQFDWSQKFIPPGGHSYSDRGGREQAEALYDPTFTVQCSACHDNKKAYVVSPHIEQARVGYRHGAHGPEAAAFSLGNYLPETPRSELAPFRVIGSGYTATYRTELQRAKTVQDPTGNCTECHTLTTQVTGQRFAADAVAQEPSVSDPTWAQVLQLDAERTALRDINARRTNWAQRSGPGGIHPWMLPVYGNELTGEASEIGPADWSKLSNCLWGAGSAEECGYRPLYTACPAPGSPAGGDASKPTRAAIQELPPPKGGAGIDRVLRLQWNYLNSYGEVPDRDDVRFNVAVKTTAIPSSGKAPLQDDFPGTAEAAGKGIALLDGEVGASGAVILIQNISYFGHSKFTEPVPSTALREFRIDLPAKCNRRYLARILPKRFCFDQSGTVFAEKGELLYADVLCT
jgi:hypothetical protein